MSALGKFSTYHIPDEGTWYAPGEMVRLDQSARRIAIVKDPGGEYEVRSCRHATEYEGTPPLLRIGLRKGRIEVRAEPVPIRTLYDA